SASLQRQGARAGIEDRVGEQLADGVGGGRHRGSSIEKRRGIEERRRVARRHGEARGRGTVESDGVALIYPEAGRERVRPSASDGDCGPGRDAHARAGESVSDVPKPKGDGFWATGLDAEA